MIAILKILVLGIFQKVAQNKHIMYIFKMATVTKDDFYRNAQSASYLPLILVGIFLARVPA